MNPSGSFKDNGMTAAFTHARMTGATPRGLRQHRQHLRQPRHLLRRDATSCGRSSSSAPGKISYGKLSQALEHGALTVQIAGDFDDALRQVQDVSRQLGIYLVNSVNPFRLEGQKTIMYRILEALRWRVAGLDRRARRQPRQRVELRQGVHRVDRNSA